MSAMDLLTFEEWEKRHVVEANLNPTSPDYSMDDMRAAWNAAVAEAARFLAAYAARHDDLRRAALECAAENIGGYMRSPRLCSCCGQAVKVP
jgi:hypothetical protein